MSHAETQRRRGIRSAKAKDGTFKGTFKAYTLVKGKPKATTVNVSGILVGDKGYGTLSVKKPSVSAPVEIR